MLIKFGFIDTELGVMLFEDFAASARSVEMKTGRSSGDGKVMERFLDAVRKGVSVTVSKLELRRTYNLSEDDITALIRRGLLTMRDMETLWLSVPCAGCFLPQLRAGRRSLLRTLRRAKNKELLQSTLLTRKLRGLVPSPSMRALCGEDLYGGSSMGDDGGRYYILQMNHFSSKLGTRFHLTDAKGADTVVSITTSSGPLIRLADS